MPGLTSPSLRSPSFVITRESRMITRYARLFFTRKSCSGMISSLAVARRITPLRCRLPCSSTKPFGSVNSNSVLKAISGELLRCVNGGEALGFGDKTLAYQNLSPEGAPDSTGEPSGPGTALGAVGLLHLEGLERDLERLGGVRAVARVEG